MCLFVYYVSMWFNLFIMSASPIERQLTHDNAGHCINSTQCFSPDGNWIVYDSRNDDSQLAANGEIHMVNTETGKDVFLYKTLNQTQYGPGVGAATFSPEG